MRKAFSILLAIALLPFSHFVFAIDTDSDGVPDEVDNCIFAVNTDQSNFDSDPFGDACDSDDDNDGFYDVSDPAPQDATVPAYVALRQQSRSYSRFSESHSYSVTTGTDVDGDSVSDYIVSPVIELVSGRSKYSTKVYSGLTGNEVYTLNMFGNSVVVGDVDSDGVNDFGLTVLIDTRYDSGSHIPSYVSEINLVSGKTGNVLYKVNDSSLGYNLSGVADLNSDGVEDLIVGLPTYQGISFQSLSGQDGSLIYRDYRFASGSSGTVVTSVDDLDAGGKPDFLINNPSFETADGKVGVLIAISAETRAIIFEIYGSPDEAFGSEVVLIDDINNDGFRDFAVSSPIANVNGVRSGKVTMHSGIDGELLYTVKGEAENYYFGSIMKSAGDVNADGFSDLMVRSTGAISGGETVGMLQLVSGVNGEVLHSFYGYSNGRNFASLGDINNDGYAELAVGDGPLSPQLNTLYVFSLSPDFYDLDGDGLRAEIDPDSNNPDVDGDTVKDGLDNCVTLVNPLQKDLDRDRIGDVCDDDIDGDGVKNSDDVFPLDSTEFQDSDGDGKGDNGDNCPMHQNADQLDADGDTVGDACDVFPNDPAESIDSDGDGVGDNTDAYPFNAQASELKTSDGGGSLPLILLGLLFGLMFYRSPGLAFVNVSLK